MKCYQITNLGYSIELHQMGRDNFMVVYGASAKAGLTYDRAATELGAAILHALSCEGKIDNSTIEEQVS